MIYHRLNSVSTQSNITSNGPCSTISSLAFGELKSIGTAPNCCRYALLKGAIITESANLLPISRAGCYYFLASPCSEHLYGGASYPARTAVNQHFLTGYILRVYSSKLNCKQLNNFRLTVTNADQEVHATNGRAVASAWPTFFGLGATQSWLVKTNSEWAPCQCPGITAIT